MSEGISASCLFIIRKNTIYLICFFTLYDVIFYPREPWEFINSHVWAETHANLKDKDIKSENYYDLVECRQCVPKMGELSPGKIIWNRYILFCSEEKGRNTRTNFSVDVILITGTEKNWIQTPYIISKVKKEITWYFLNRSVPVSFPFLLYTLLPRLSRAKKNMTRIVLSFLNSVIFRHGS